MAAVNWLLQTLYTAILGSGGFTGGISSGGSLDQIGVLVNTTYGTVRGFVDSSENVTVVKFYGIRYAKPPIGSLRFKPPVAPDKWSGIQNATVFGNECPHKYTPDMLKNGGPVPRDEDCLFLNVYTPIVSDGASPKALPVMVWIHGGGYTVGAGSRYDVTGLSRKGVVMVTINYRLDVLGFLSTGDDVIPGNYGMLDQVSALKWVQENIGAFGGDPNKVTIFGESSGGNSVSLLTLSPLTKGLFQSALMQSGCSLNAWAFQHPGMRINARVSSRLIADAMGCPDIGDSTEILTCLQRADVDVLINQTNQVLSAVSGSVSIMSPRVENVYGFLPDLPINILSRGGGLKVNTLAGYTTDEIGGTASWWIKNAAKLDVDLFKRVVLSELSALAIVDIHEIVQMAVDIYIGTNTDEETIKRAVLQVLNDISVIGPELLETSLILKSTPLNKHYLYEFNQRSTGYNTLPDWMSASHFEDVAYVFGIELQGFRNWGYTPTQDEKMVSALMMDLWTSFAKTGVPTSPLMPSGVSWQEYTLTSPNYLKINSNSSLLTLSRPRVVEFFSKILQRIDTAKNPVTAIIG